MTVPVLTSPSSIEIAIGQGGGHPSLLPGHAEGGEDMIAVGEGVNLGGHFVVVADTSAERQGDDLQRCR
jgi:hypothetical protein